MECDSQGLTDCNSNSLSISIVIHSQFRGSPRRNMTIEFSSDVHLVNARTGYHYKSVVVFLSRHTWVISLTLSA